MRRSVALGGAALWAMPAVAQVAQTPTVPAPVSAPVPGNAAIITYPPDYFASQRPATAYDMVSRIPGFSLDIGNVDARGLASSAGNVLINGQRPSTKSDTLDAILTRLSATSVERIELIRGGAPGIDMQGRSVVVNIVLKTAAKTEIVLEANAYVYLRSSFTAPLLKGQYSRRDGDKLTEFSLSATTDRTSETLTGTRRLIAPDGSLIQAADLDFRDSLRDVTARGAIERPFIGGLLRLNGLAELQHTKNRQSYFVTAGSGPDELNTDNAHDRTGELGLNWKGALSPRGELEITGLQRLSKDDYLGFAFADPDDTSFALRTTGGESVLRGVYRFRQSERWAYEGGGEVAYNFLNSRTRYIDNGTLIALPNASVKVNELRGEVFAQATWHPSAKWTVEGATRVEFSRIAQTGDFDRSRQFTYVKPRLLVTWEPSAGNQVRLRLEHEVGQLDFGDFTASTELSTGVVAGGNADLRPQRSKIAEAVYEHRFWKKGSVELTLSHAWLSDVIELIPLVGGYDAVGNIGAGTRDIAQLRTTVPLDRLGLSNALLRSRFTWTRSRVTDPLTGERRRISSEMPFDCGLGFSQDLFKGRVTYGMDHSCERKHIQQYRTAELRTQISDPFITAFVSYKMNDKTTFQLDWGNVINRELRLIRNIYAGPRDTAPLLYSEDRRTRFGSYLYFQLRRVL